MNTKQISTALSWIVLMVLISFSMVACAPAPAVQSEDVPSQEIAPENVEEIERNWNTKVTLTFDNTPMLPEELQQYREAVQNKTAAFQWANPQVVGEATQAINLLYVDVPIAVWNPTVAEIAKQMSSGVWNQTAFNQVFGHFANHLEQQGGSPNDISLAGTYAQRVIQQALAGDGLKFYRMASADYEEGYLFISKVNNKMWAVWTDILGRPLTSYAPRQKEYSAIEDKWVRWGLELIEDPSRIPQTLKDKWVTVPATLRFYLWSAERMVEYQLFRVGATVQQTIESLSVASLKLAPPLPFIINPCVLSPQMEICTQDKKPNT